MAIIYIPMAKGFVNFTVVLDRLSRRVLSRRVSITMEALFCVEFRHLARREDDRRARMRLIALAETLEGADRKTAARRGDMSDQALRDAIKRYNAEGIEGLYDRPRSGRPRKLTDEQRAQLREIVVKGPDVEKEGLSAYTRDDLVKIARDKWEVEHDPSSMGRILRELGLSRQKSRPSHPKKDAKAIEAFKKGSRRPARNYQ